MRQAFAGLVSTLACAILADKRSPLPVRCESCSWHVLSYWFVQRSSHLAETWQILQASRNHHSPRDTFHTRSSSSDDTSDSCGRYPQKGLLRILKVSQGEYIYIVVASLY